MWTRFEAIHNWRVARIVHHAWSGWCLAVSSDMFTASFCTKPPSYFWGLFPTPPPPDAVSNLLKTFTVKWVQSNWVLNFFSSCSLVEEPFCEKKKLSSSIFCFWAKGNFSPWCHIHEALLISNKEWHFARNMVWFKGEWMRLHIHIRQIE